MKRLAGAVLALMLIATPALATVYYHLFEPLQTTYGTAMSGVTYYVYTAGTTDTANVYSDRAGTRSYQGSGNFTTGADGMFDKYVAAGCYAIYFTDSTRWGDIADTWDDYCYGIADSVGSGPVTATTLTATDESTLGDARADTIHVRGNVWSKDADHFRDWAGDAMWYYEMTGTRRLGTDADRVLGIGGSFQLEEDINFTRALAVTDTVDGTGDYASYLDRATLSMRPQAGKAYTYQTLDITNDRGYADRWKWGGYVGEIGGDYGAPPYGMRLITDLPDSNGALGYRTAVRLVWTVPTDDNCPRNQILNGNSVFLELYEDGATDVSHYKFERDRLNLGANASDVSKYIIFGTGTSGQYLRIGTTATESVIRAANQTLNIRDDDNSDDATLDVYWVTASVCSLSTFLTLKPTASPPPAVEGRVYMDTDHHLYVHNGTTWVQLDN